MSSAIKSGNCVMVSMRQAACDVALLYKSATATRLSRESTLYVAFHLTPTDAHLSDY